jgi:hypothetical protein
MKGKTWLYGCTMNQLQGKKKGFESSRDLPEALSQ